MARSALLVRAARTAIREDRLTALFAVVLDAHPGLARRLLAFANLPCEGDVQVSTQVRTKRGKRVDMQVRAFDAAGRIVATLWSEHKTGADYGPDQLPGYANELSDEPGRRQLITIVERLDDAPDSPCWKRLTWHEVARMLTEAGVEEAGPQWRTAATAGGAPAKQRLLHELLSYLEEEHGVVIEPISHLDVIAFNRASRFAAALVAVIDRAAELSRLTPVGKPGSSKNLEEFWQIFSDRGAWWERLGGWTELHAHNEDLWTYEQLGEPAFGAGATLPSRYHEILRDASNREWLDTVQQKGFSVALVGSHTRVYRTVYCAELMSAGATLNAQAAFLAGWLDESIALLDRHDPVIEPITDPSKRRGSKPAEPTDMADPTTGG